MQAIASDIDGTLIFNGKIKDKDKSAIQHYRQKHMFGVCSGRPLCSLSDLKDLELDFYILSTGALILDKKMKILKEEILDKTIVKEIFHQYQDKAEIIIHTNNTSCFYATFIETQKTKVKLISSFDEVKEDKIYGISLVFEDEEKTVQAMQQLHQHYQDIQGYQNKNSIDIVKKGCSKGTGVQFIHEHYQITQMIGIGDSYNDIPLFQACQKSFTFHTSPIEVQQYVDECIENIAEVIQKMEEIE